MIATVFPLFGLGHCSANFRMRSKLIFFTVLSAHLNSVFGSQLFVQHDLVYPGALIKEYSEASLGFCIKTCDENSDCAAFTMPDSLNSCKLMRQLVQVPRMQRLS